MKNYVVISEKYIDTKLHILVAIPYSDFKMRDFSQFHLIMDVPPSSSLSTKFFTPLDSGTSTTAMIETNTFRFYGRTYNLVSIKYDRILIILKNKRRNREP